MKTKNLVFLLVIIWLYPGITNACSCFTKFICEYIEEETTEVAFQAKVIAHKTYTSSNQAIYLELINRYKDEVGMTDTIKLYGRKIESGCAINLQLRYPVGDTIIMALGEIWNSWQIVNPDSLSENYWEYYPNLCSSVRLRVEDGNVKGRITEDLTEYPLALFDEEFENCNFSPEDLKEFKCSSEDFTLFPNPSLSDKITIEGKYRWNTFERVRVFTPNGQLHSEIINESPNHKIEINKLQDGLYVIEIICDDQKFYKKVVVRK